jgi:hypothetical protein
MQEGLPVSMGWTMLLMFVVVVVVVVVLIVDSLVVEGGRVVMGGISVSLTDATPGVQPRTP